MKTFAQLDENNKVINIAVFADNADLVDGWVEYTESNPAYINGDYVDGYFYPEQPFPSWTRNKGQWICPKPRPDGLTYIWDEEAQDWVNVEANA